jgi:plastocyanin
VRKRFLPLPFLAGLAVAVIPSFAADKTVNTVSDNTFAPKTVTINQGEKVTWSNDSGGFHNVKFDDGTFEQPPVASTDSWTVSRTFAQPGTYAYYCSIHGASGGSGMSGTVVVQPATTSGTTTTTGTTPTTTVPTTKADQIAPRLTVRALSRRLHRRALRLRVKVNERSSVRASGKVKVPGAGSVKLRTARRTLGAGKQATLTLRLSRTALATVRRALGRHPVARLKITARDAAGNVTSTRIAVKLKS